MVDGAKKTTLMAILNATSAPQAHPCVLVQSLAMAMPKAGTLRFHDLHYLAAGRLLYLTQERQTSISAYSPG